MGGRVAVAVRWQGRALPGFSQQLRQLARATLQRIGISQGSLAVLLCDDRTMELFNRHFRRENKPTDVLSFPSHERLPSGTVHLGDVAISLETASRQAAAAGHSLQREVAILLIHGILHVCGFDHERDEGEMEALERKLREELL
ncbi:MAG: rRNA maturation RNase YbeY [Thermoanaerobaculum sp.]|nr:rRNA maturation RNase YbeY [Thermoanaerobaculum sp.]MDW7968208.1 rRNA maturation RNase YbeY [Thermoanaerobaculum sp.]